MHPYAAPRTIATPSHLIAAALLSMLWACAESADVSNSNEPSPEAVQQPTADISLVLDYSAAPHIVVDARGAGTHEILSSLAGRSGFAYVRSDAITADPPIEAVVEGTVGEIIDWLLLGESYVLSYAEADGGRQITALDWLAHGAGPSGRRGNPSVAHGPVVIELDVASIDAYLGSQPDLNEDLRTWLEATRASVAAGDEDPTSTPVVRISLYDAPTSLADLMQRLTIPLSDEFAETRRENRAPGTPPRHLTGSNDAAQNDVAEAMARTTAMARRNVEALQKALETACPHAECPGVPAPQQAPTAAAPPPAKKDPTAESR